MQGKPGPRSACLLDGLKKSSEVPGSLHLTPVHHNKLLLLWNFSIRCLSPVIPSNPEARRRPTPPAALANAQPQQELPPPSSLAHLQTGLRPRRRGRGRRPPPAKETAFSSNRRARDARVGDAPRPRFSARVPAPSTQYPERAPAGGRVQRPAEARPHPFPLAAAATRPGPFPEYSKTQAANPLQRSCTHAESLGIGDTGKKGRPLGCRTLTLRCYQL